MCLASESVSLNGLISIFEGLSGFGGSKPETDVEELRSEAMGAVADCACELMLSEEVTVDARLLNTLLDMPVNWQKCSERVAQKGQQFIAKQPLDQLIPLIRKAAASKAGKFGECLATSAMMKIFGAEPLVAVECLDAMVSGGFGVEGAPMMLRMLLPRVPAESSARVVAGLAEHGATGPDFDACWEAAVSEDTLEGLPLSLRERIYAQKKRWETRERSRSRDRNK